jgi:glycosyltransferase involved in cell wall biosynthesis
VRLDIVMPAHNEESRIDRTLHAYRDGGPGPDVRFLVALDSCTDRTAEIVREHERADDRVRSFEYPKLGKGGVIAATFARANAELIAFVDADGATPPRELLRLTHAARHADGAIASRRHPAALLPARRPLAREISSAGFAASVRAVVAYYGKEDLRIRPLEDGLPTPRRGRRVFLLASFLDKPHYRSATADAVRRLSRRYDLVHRDAVPQIRTWEFR